MAAPKSLSPSAKPFFPSNHCYTPTESLPFIQLLPLHAPPLPLHAPTPPPLPTTFLLHYQIPSMAFLNHSDLQYHPQFTQHTVHVNGDALTERETVKKTNGKVGKNCFVKSVFTVRKVKDRCSVRVPKNRKRESVDQSKRPSARVDTTFMIRNIPNKLRREELLEILDEHCRYENEMAENRSDPVRSAYDFVYLPIDFTYLGNKGYAFVNFTTNVSATRFQNAMNNCRWTDYLESKKQCAFSVARIQGRDALVKHFEESMFPTNTDAYLPVLLSPPRDGSLPRTNPIVVGKLSAYRNAKLNQV